MARGDVVGLLAAYPAGRPAAGEHETALLAALAGQLAVAVRNAQLHEQATRLGEEREAALAAEDWAAARAHYQAAAQYPTAYYGQIARARLGLNELGLHRPPEPTNRAQLMNLEVVRAVQLLYAIDAFPPATLDIALSGWVPTLELTGYVRALAAPGPVRVLQKARSIDAEKVDEACFVWDSDGRLVAQATQLAGIRL